jgi:hypothetical protein
MLYQELSGEELKKDFARSYFGNGLTVTEIRAVSQKAQNPLNRFHFTYQSFALFYSAPNDLAVRAEQN